MILYDHLMRLTADAPNRFADLREGVVGSFGALRERSLLFVRSGCDASVSNIVIYPFEHPPASHSHTGSFAITDAYCHLDFDPVVFDPFANHGTVGEFVSRLADTMRWDLCWGRDGDFREAAMKPAVHTKPIFPHFSSNLEPWAQLRVGQRLDVDVGRFAGLRVECRIPDAELLDALNVGQYKGVRFRTRVIRLALRCEAVL